MDLVDVIVEFFKSFGSNLDSLTDVLNQSVDVFNFLSYVWLVCIPNEIRLCFEFLFFMSFFCGLVLHVKK